MYKRQTYTGAFDNKNAGTGKTVTITPTYSGADVGNYSITNHSTITADVAVKTLTATASAANKVYDGNTTATATLTFTGLVGSETLGQTVGSTFNNKNVGTGKTVTITPSYTGADVGNYSVTDHATVTANITAKALSVSGITASDKTYDGNDVATLNLSLIHI